LLITATATHGQLSVLQPGTGTHWTRETRDFGPAKFHQRPSLHAHLIPSIITTQMVQLLEKRLTSSRLRTKVHQSQRRDTTKIRPSQPPSAFSKIKPFFTMLGRFAGRPAAPQNSSANPSGRVAGTFRITIGGMVHPVSNPAPKPSQIVQHSFRACCTTTGKGMMMTSMRENLI
jgi:hypothetical protein